MIESKSKRRQVIGPPGTGKTTWLGQEVRKCVDAGLEVCVSSLTRTAAAEVAGRDLPISRDCIATLHAHAYRAIGKPELYVKHIGDWNERYGNANGFPMATTAPIVDTDDLSPMPVELQVGDKLYEKADLFRHQGTDCKVWPFDVREFHETWRKWKAETEVIDFTDMIEMALSDTTCPTNMPDVLLVDEAQDLSALEYRLLCQWEKAARAMICVGDPWQCQPPGTLVRTNMGEVPIEHLVPKLHRVHSFNRRSGFVTGFRNPLRFKVTSRSYSGPMLTISCRDRQTRCTPNHRWTVRMTRQSSGRHCVYLMRKGSWFRIGQCLLHRTPGKKDNGAFAPTMRARTEGADAVWILKTFAARTESLAWEQIIAARYGIPTTCFADHGGLRTSKVIEAIYLNLNLDDLFSRANQCLTSFGRLMSLPFWSPRAKNSQEFGRRIPLEVFAANLLPEVMRVPVPICGKELAWRNFGVSSQAYSGDVYSLEVERHEHYIADGIITHNSLYTWRGADPSLFDDPDIPDNHKMTLGQSYRIPREVHRVATSWIKRLSTYKPIEYKPRDCQGRVERIYDASYRNPWVVVNEAERLAANGKTVMILASCAYQMAPTVALLRANGIPFANPWRIKRGDWNPLRARKASTTTVQRLLSFVKPITPQRSSSVWRSEGDNDGSDALGAPWNIGEFQQWTDMLVSDRCLHRGTKAQLKEAAETAPYDAVSPELLRKHLKDEAYAVAVLMLAGDLDVTAATRWLLENATASKQKPLAFPSKVLARMGADALTEDPRIFVGTAHSMKGAEADCVFLYPDISNAAAKSAELYGHDDIVRTFYVAMTRAKEELYITVADGCDAAEIEL